MGLSDNPTGWDTVGAVGGGLQERVSPLRWERVRFFNFVNFGAFWVVFYELNAFDFLFLHWTAHYYAQFNGEIKSYCNWARLSCKQLTRYRPGRNAGSPTTCDSAYFKPCLGPPDSPTQTASWSVQPFCRTHERDQQTDRHTHTEKDHATPSVAIGAFSYCCSAAENFEVLTADRINRSVCIILGSDWSNCRWDTDI